GTRMAGGGTRIRRLCAAEESVPAGFPSGFWLQSGSSREIPGGRRKTRKAGAYVEGAVRVLVLGGDGYCGWPTALHLSARGHDVGIVDSFVRRLWDHELGVETLTRIRPLHERVELWRELGGRPVVTFAVDLQDHHALEELIGAFEPATAIHVAEQRSAPFSMIDREHAVLTQVNNVVGTVNLLFALKDLRPDCHLIKLGTMGEYGTPNVDIEE